MSGKILSVTLLTDKALTIEEAEQAFEAFKEKWGKKESLISRYKELAPAHRPSGHTWGQNLMQHPHIHCIILSGGLNNLGKWAHSKFFLPVKVLTRKFWGCSMQGCYLC